MLKLKSHSFLCFPTWKYIKLVFNFIFQLLQKINTVVLQKRQQRALLHNKCCLGIIFELKPKKDLSYYCYRH